MLGHRRLAYVWFRTAQPCEHHARRWLAFHEVCRRLGLEHEASTWELSAPVADSRPDEYADFCRTLHGDRAPTGVVCFNDCVAATVASVAEDAGLAVPRDVSVVGFDNDSAVETYARPLTTIDPRLAEMGRAAARRLIQRMSSGAGSEPEVTFVQPALIMRSSTAPCLAASASDVPEPQPPVDGPPPEIRPLPPRMGVPPAGVSYSA